MGTTLTGVLTKDQYDVLNKIADSPKDRASDGLDKDAFLNLMLVQLQHQDPLSPMDNSQMMTQMADFTTVEQLTNISESMETMTTMVALVSAQMDDVLTGSKTNSENGDAMLEEQKALREQNETLLKEMIKMNEMLSTYFGSTGSDDEAETAEKLLSAL